MCIGMMERCKDELIDSMRVKQERTDTQLRNLREVTFIMTPYLNATLPRVVLHIFENELSQNIKLQNCFMNL